MTNYVCLHVCCALCCVGADYFATPPQVLVPHGNRFLFGEHSFLFVAAVNPVHETEVHLMITRDNTTHKLFQRAILPVDLTQHSYTILDTSDGSVFLHVNHQVSHPLPSSSLFCVLPATANLMLC